MGEREGGKQRYAVCGREWEWRERERGGVEKGEKPRDVGERGGRERGRETEGCKKKEKNKEMRERDGVERNWSGVEINRDGG